MKCGFLVNLLVLLASSGFANDPFIKFLELQEPEPNQQYYDLLPKITDENPDLYLIRSRNLKNFSLEDNYLGMIEEATGATILIETGTYLGDTTHNAAQHFSMVHSIELGKELFEKAKKRFAKKKNICLYHGDSVKLLPDILKKIKDTAVIFLDAHFSMGNTVKGEGNTPILTELEHIKKSNHKNSVIIVDDIRMFYDPLIELEDNFMEGYPTLNTIVEKILEINPAYKIAIVYDTLIAFTSEQITVSPLIRAITMSRLYDGNNYVIEDIVRAELCIAQAQENDRQILLELAERWVEQFSESAGLSRHYPLWAGLILLNHNQYDNALKQLMLAKKRGLKHWRIDWYIAMAQAQCFFDIR